VHKDCKEILFSGEMISKRCEELAEVIEKDYKGKNVLLVGLLKGSVPFFAELAKHIHLDVEFDFMDVSSYDGVESTGNVIVKKDIDIDITGKNILIIEDILDTGKTLHTVRAMLLEKGAASVEIATLLSKQKRREYPIQAKYVGFEIPNAFVIGYGMDYDEKYRNLPYVGILKEEVYAQ
jgi:hypoxanthine phosphoribosyltransferase